jgi:hypothetical protein
MPARSNRIAAECRNTCMVTDFCTSDGQTSVAFPTYLASLCSKSVPAESSSSLCGEQRGFWLTGPLGQPGTQDGDCARGERRDPLLSSLPVATHMRTGSEMDIGAAQTGQFRLPKTGLDSEAEQCGVAPPGHGFRRPNCSTSGSTEDCGSARPIGRGEQGVDFQKYFTLRERLRLQFRAEMFNAFNHVQFGGPNSNSGSGANFGLIGGARSPADSDGLENALLSIGCYPDYLIHTTLA